MRCVALADHKMPEATREPLRIRALANILRTLSSAFNGRSDLEAKTQKRGIDKFALTMRRRAQPRWLDIGIVSRHECARLPEVLWALKFCLLMMKGVFGTLLF